MRRLGFAGALASLIAFIGCGGRALAVDHETPVDAATSATADAAPAPPADRLGITSWHFGDPRSTTVLEIHPDHTYRWEHDQCDYKLNGSGRWEPELEGELLLQPNADCTAWHTGSRVDGPETLEAVRRGDTLEITHLGRGNTAPKELWTLGLVCAVCYGEGPTGVRPCDEPLTSSCR